LAAKLNFFNNTMGFTRHESRGLLVAEPKLACCGLESGLLPRLKFWKGEMRIPLIQLRKIVQKNPRMLMYSLNDSLRPKLIFYLIMTLHMEPRQVLKLLLAFPHFLDYSLEEHYLPITRYFISELGYSSLEVRNVLLKCPRIMTSSLHKIKHVVGYFRYELGLEASQVKRVLYQAPQIMGLSDVNLRGKVEFIRGAFALDDMELRQVLAAVPTLLVCGVEPNLQPKLDYLRGVFDNYHESRGDMIDLDDNDESIHSATNGSALLRQTFLKLPTLLIYSLERRIRPRLEQIVQAGVSPHKITVGIPMKQDKFETWLQRHEERLELRLGGVQKGKSQSVLLVESTESRNDGRIVHWTRERRKT
jgi:mTERF domain-containing protein